MRLRNIDIKPLLRTPTFRKVALGTWSRPGDPQIYGSLQLDLTRVNQWRNQLPARLPKITITHLVARAIALAMEKYPDLNGLIRFRKIYLREHIDIFFQVVTGVEQGRQDLTGIMIKDVNRKNVLQLAEEMRAKVERVRTKGDTEIQKTARLMDIFPAVVVRIMLAFVAFLSYTLNIRFPGVPPDQFGGCMISNVGWLGLDAAYAPLVPYSRTPLIIVIGQEKKRPLVIEDKVEIRDTVALNATIDHRFCDGALLAKMVRVIEDCFAEPEKHFGFDRLTPDQGVAS